jgi:DNA repair protein RadD
VTLRPYQQAAVDDLRDGDLLVSPTGTGKTKMLCQVALNEVAGGGMALWVAHRLELLAQASNALREAWLTPELNVLVRSIQELRSSPPLPVSMLIVDEAHHLPSDDWGRLITEQYPRAKLVGATATPERGDGRGLGSMFKRIVSTITVKEAIAQGYLVQPTVLRPSRELGPGELAQRPEQAWLDHAKGLKTIVFYPSVDLAVQGACAFRDAGAVAAAVWGAMPAENRRKALEMFARGEIEVLTSVNLLTEGFDVPDVECCILARGFGTSGGYLQAVGRALRPVAGKKRALVLDLRGCSHAHGDPDDDRSFHLEGRGIRRANDAPDVRFCPVCGVPTTGTACEECGHSGEMRKRPPRVLGLPLERFARVRQDDDAAQAKRLARWLSEARAAGSKDGRALHRFKGTYGDWPSRAVQQAALKILG